MEVVLLFSKNVNAWNIYKIDFKHLNKYEKMASLKQIGNLLEKSFSKWEYKKAIKLSDNESKTRDYLIEPFFNILGYNKSVNINLLKYTNSSPRIYWSNKNG